MKSPQTSALTVRFTPEMREQLECLAEHEHRPAANQVVHFVSIGISDYLQSNRCEFERDSDGKLTLRFLY